MKVEHVSQTDIVTLARVVDLIPEDDDNEDGDPFSDSETLRPGRYAMDGTGTVWRREDTITAIFQEFMDLKESLKPKKSK